MTSASAQTELMRLESSGGIFGKFRHITHHNFNGGAFKGPNTTAEKIPVPSAGSEGQDDCNNCTPALAQQWLAPYGGRLVKVIIRILQNGGSSPDIQCVWSMSVNGGTDVDGTTVISLDDAGVQTVTMPTTGWTFNAGDRISMALKKRGNSSDRIEDVPTYITCVWEYNIQD